MFNLLYVTGWNHLLNEPFGGRCVSEHTTKEAALEAAKDYSHCAFRLWGRGSLVITGPDHELVYCVARAETPIVWDFQEQEARVWGGLEVA